MVSHVERELNDYNNKLSKVFNLISIFGKYRVIGSSQLKKIRYNSDFDLESHLDLKSKNIDDATNTIYKHFKKIFIDSKRNPDLFITDFKCGVDKNGEPLRWSYNNMMAGF